MIYYSFIHELGTLCICPWEKITFGIGKENAHLFSRCSSSPSSHILIWINTYVWMTVIYMYLVFPFNRRVLIKVILLSFATCKKNLYKEKLTNFLIMKEINCCNLLLQFFIQLQINIIFDSLKIYYWPDKRTIQTL